MVITGCVTCHNLFGLLDTALAHLEAASVYISAATPEEDWATERAMTAAWINSELERLGFKRAAATVAGEEE